MVQSFGTVTDTQYVYLESSAENSTVNGYGASMTPGTGGLNIGSMLNLLSSYLFGGQPLLLIGSGVMVLVLTSTIAIRRRHGGRTSALSSAEMDERLLNYITDHKGAISMSRASEDLGFSTEELGEAIMRLKADGRLTG
jgi:hypothetical protein